MTMFSAPTYFHNLLFLYFKGNLLEASISFGKRNICLKFNDSEIFIVFISFSPKIKLKIVLLRIYSMGPYI